MKTLSCKKKATKEEFNKLKDNVSKMILHIKKARKDSPVKLRTITELSKLKFNDKDKKVIYNGGEIEVIRCFIPEHLLKKGRIK